MNFKKATFEGTLRKDESSKQALEGKLGARRALRRRRNAPVNFLVKGLHSRWIECPWPKRKGELIQLGWTEWEEACLQTELILMKAELDDVVQDPKEPRLIKVSNLRITI